MPAPASPPRRLADAAPDIFESSHYERMLIELDGLHPSGSALSPTTGAKAELLDCLEVAIDLMVNFGGDSLSLELLLNSALFGWTTRWALDQERSVSRFL
jgi:hypothetical protein